MNLVNLIDGTSALIVFGGTALATVLGAGWSDTKVALSKLRQLGSRPFDPEVARGVLARQIQEIQREGLLRAQPLQFGDGEFSAVTDALIGRRSIPALLTAHESQKARRVGESDNAVRTLLMAADLSPVFGLAGTLVSLSQLPAGGMVAPGSYSAAISMAVVTTLYGLLGANLLLGPLARIIERKAQTEETNRQCVIDWIASQVEAATRPRRDRPVAVSAASQ